MKTLKISFLILLGIILCSCSATTRANSAFEDGDYDEFCKISAESLDEGGQSYHNVGLCYENAWGGYPKDIEKAIESYNVAARWNIPASREKLESLDEEVPYPDLHQQELQEERESEIRTVSIATSVLSIALLGAAVWLDHEYNNDYREVPDFEVPATCQFSRSQSTRKS